MSYVNNLMGLSTNAPDGRYIAILPERCNCCDENFYSETLLIVKNGKFIPENVYKAAQELMAYYDEPKKLHSLNWLGDGSVLFNFISAH
jgi:uncharacterized protein YfaT (DUF1175 family)